MQFRRLDPLANASPYQRIAKAPVKSFTMTEEQFDRVKERHPELIAIDGVGAVVAHPYRDYLEVHYGFSEVVGFRDNFGELFNRSVGAFSKADAPRGVVISFRDRPNRPLANPTFWPLALEEDREWVEMSWVAVPELAEPETNLDGGFTVRQAMEADRDTVAKVESEATGQLPLTEGGLNSLYENARALQLVRDSSGAPVALLNLRTEPGGWGILDQAILPGLRDQLLEPLIRRSIAWLRNNGSRRIRVHVYLNQTAELAVLRGVGFTAGETGLDYTRPVDASEVKAKIEERQAHGTMIKFGWWR